MIPPVARMNRLIREHMVFAAGRNSLILRWAKMELLRFLMGTTFSKAGRLVLGSTTVLGFFLLVAAPVNGQLFGGFQRSSSSSQPANNYSRSSVQTSGYSQQYNQPASKRVESPLTKVRTVQPASTSWNSQRDVKNSIPWQKLNQSAKKKIQSVVQSASIYRRLPVNRIECDPQFFTFALRNPDTVVNMWKVFGVSQMTLKQQAPYQFSGNDGSGTSCNAELIYGDSNIHIYYGTGVYQGPVFRRRITGRCVAVVRTGYLKGKNQYVLENKMDIFLKVDNVAADLVARTLQPMVGKSTDHNFRESLAFLQAFSATAVTEPHRTNYLIQKMPEVNRKTKDQFHKIVATIAKRQVAYQTGSTGTQTAKPNSHQTRKTISAQPKSSPRVRSASIDAPAVYRSIR